MNTARATSCSHDNTFIDQDDGAIICDDCMMLIGWKDGDRDYDSEAKDEEIMKIEYGNFHAQR